MSGAVYPEPTVGLSIPEAAHSDTGHGMGDTRLEVHREEAKNSQC